jgi:hypothetical protein
MIHHHAGPHTEQEDIMNEATELIALLVAAVLWGTLVMIRLDRRDARERAKWSR